MRCLCHIQLARLMEAEMRRAGAMRHYAEALRHFPGSIEAHACLGGLSRYNADAADLKRVEFHLATAAALAERLYNSGAAPEGAGGGATDEDPALVGHELEHANIAKQNLAFHLCQEGRDEEACHVLDELGFDFRLGRGVLHYPLPAPPTPARGAPGAPPRLLRGLDGFLEPSLLQMMQRSFGQSSPFWGEHHYSFDSTGYFSYMHDMRGIREATPAGADGSGPRHALEAIIRRVYEAVAERFPEVKGATQAEWWAHCRPHQSGHQLHFDSDYIGHIDHKGEHAPPGEGEDTGEASLFPAPQRPKKVLHPLVGTVLYLSGGIGGPTMVTDQTLGGGLAKEGWLVYPEENRLLMYPGHYLHGVVPGRGPTPDPDRRRVTFMVSFWKEKLGGKAGVKGDAPCSCRPFPGRASRFTWPELLRTPPGGPVRARSSPREAPAFSVGKVWESIEGSEDSSSEEDSKGGEGAAAAASPGPGLDGEEEEEEEEEEECPPYEACFQGF